MRVTVTIDKDLGRRLKAEAGRTGLLVSQVIIHFLHLGLEERPTDDRFKIRARPLGLRAKLNYSKTSELLDLLDRGR